VGARPDRVCEEPLILSEGWVDALTRGNVDQVKTVLASVVFALAMLAVLAVKIVVVRGLSNLHGLLPALVLAVLAPFALTWVSSAGDYLFGW
jgi:hypothetical protein